MRQTELKFFDLCPKAASCPGLHPVPTEVAKLFASYTTQFGFRNVAIWSRDVSKPNLDRMQKADNEVFVLHSDLIQHSLCDVFGSFLPALPALNIRLQAGHRKPKDHQKMGPSDLL